jgi:curved DNA-binding protein CbpA
MNLYEILGVKKNSSTDEIKKKYRALALIYHPDKHNDPEKTILFQQIQEAYEILSDPFSRKDYDLNTYLQNESVYGSRNDAEETYEFTDEDYKLLQIYYDKCTQSVEFKFMMSLFCKLPNETRDKMYQKINIKEILKKFTKTRILNLNKIKVIDVSKLFEDITIHLNISFQKLYNGFCEEILIKGISNSFTFFVTSSNYCIHFQNNLQSRITLEFTTKLEEYFSSFGTKLIYTMPLNLYEYYFVKDFVIPLPNNYHEFNVETIKGVHILEDLGFFNPKLKKRDLLLVKFNLELNPIPDKFKNVMKEIFDRSNST